MNRIRTLLAATVVALVGAATLAAPEAKASHEPVIEYETRGGFVLWNYQLKIYSSGFTLGTMTSPRDPGETLYLYDYISTRKLASLRSALDRARFSRLPATVRSQYTIMDVPDRVVKYRGKTVTYTTTGAQSDPVASATFVSALTAIADVFTKMADEPLVTYQASGGLAGIQDKLTITRSGRAKFERSMRGTTEPAVERQLEFAKVNELKRRIVAADWWNLPGQFDWPAGVVVMDGVSFSVGVANTRDQVKTIRSKTAADEPEGFERVMEQIYDIVHDLTT